MLLHPRLDTVGYGLNLSRQLTQRAAVLAHNFAGALGVDTHLRRNSMQPFTFLVQVLVHLAATADHIIDRQAQILDLCPQTSFHKIGLTNGASG